MKKHSRKAARLTRQRTLALAMRNAEALSPSARWLAEHFRSCAVG